MTVPLWVWAITIAFIVGLLLFDFIFHVRQAHIPTLKEAAFWSAVYVGVAWLTVVLRTPWERKAKQLAKDLASRSIHALLARPVLASRQQYVVNFLLRKYHQ